MSRTSVNIDWVGIRSQLQDAIDALPPQCDQVKDFLSTLVKTKTQEPETVYKASQLELEQARALLDIEFDLDMEDYVWKLDKNIILDSSWDTSWEISAIRQIKLSRYYKIRDEALVRSIIDVLICGRLERLKDDKANNHLYVTTEVDIHTKARKPKAVDTSAHNTTVIKGRADWAIGYSLLKKSLSSKLIIIEAKREGGTSKGIAQLMCYLAGVQDTRAAEDKTNHQVFGILTDSAEFRFALLDESRRMFLSSVLEWRTDAHHIVTFIDHILEKAIESSPHTTPSRFRNAQLLNYSRHLRSSFDYGGDWSSAEPKPMVDVDDDSIIHLVDGDSVIVTINTSSDCMEV